MSKFYDQFENNSNVHINTLDQSHLPMLHDHMIVSTHNKRKLNLKAHQLPNKDVHVNTNWWRYKVRSDCSTCLQNGTEAIIYLDRNAGSGHQNQLYARMVIQNNTGSACELVNAPHLIDQIEKFTPSGTSIQVTYGQELWNNLVRYHSQEEWNKIARLLNSNRNYGRGKPIPNGATVVYYVPLISNFLDVAQFPSYVIDGDLKISIRFRNPSQTVISGSAPTLVDLTIESHMEQLPSHKLNAYRQKYKSQVHHFFIPYIRRQTFNQVLNVNQTYEVNLSSIKGDVVWVDLFVRNSNSTGINLRNYLPLTSFEWLDHNGDQLNGQQVVEARTNLDIMQRHYWPADYVSRDFNNLYAFSFSIDDSAPIHYLCNGTKLGSFPFTTYERLRITTTGAGVNEVQRTVVAGGAGASGTYFINWQTPYGVESTPALAYNSTTAQIKSAIEALQSFDGIVTVGATLDQTVSPATFTFSGNYANKELFNKGYKVIVRNNSVQTAGAVQLQYDNILVTSGVDGITDGANYEINVIAYTTSVLGLQPNGSIDVRHV